MTHLQKLERDLANAHMRRGFTDALNTTARFYRTREILRIRREIADLKRGGSK